jgi:glutathione S-transferase
MPLPELLHFRVSHYNEKVRWTLDLKKVAHTRRTLLPGFHIPRARWVSGQNKLPVLVLDGRVLHDSSAIIAELERLHPEPALYPDDEDERKRALEIEEYFDEEVAPDLRRLFWSSYLDDPEACTRMATAGAGGTTQTIWRALFPAMRPAFRGNMGVKPEALERARERLPQHVDRLEAEIGPSGFLVGDRFTSRTSPLPP